MKVYAYICIFPVKSKKFSQVSHWLRKTLIFGVILTMACFFLPCRKLITYPHLEKFGKSSSLSRGEEQKLAGGFKHF